MAYLKCYGSMKGVSGRDLEEASYVHHPIVNPFLEARGIDAAIRGLIV